VPQGPDILLFWQDIQDISGYPGGVTARFEAGACTLSIKPWRACSIGQRPMVERQEDKVPDGW